MWSEVDKKIISIHQIADRFIEYKEKQMKTVHCHGTFDYLHYGHLEYFLEASTLGDKLLVTITADKFVKKGEGRPLFNQQMRARSIASLSFVDFVAINDHADAVELLRLCRPDIYVKGSDYADWRNDPTGKISDEVGVVEENGGTVFYTQSNKLSSTDLIKTIRGFCI